MFTTSHALAGAFVLFILHTAYPGIFPMNWSFIMASMVFANLPDLDILWAEKLSLHHRSPLHKPMFWIALSLAGTVVSLYTGPVAASIALLFFLQTMVHLLSDWSTAMTTGIQLFWPLSKTEYSLFSIRPPYGEFRPMSLDWKAYKRFAKYYLENKPRVAIEIAISMLGLVALLI